VSPKGRPEDERRSAQREGSPVSGAPPLRLLGIDHVVLRAVDVPRMERFYRDVLGCTVLRRQEDLGLVQLRAGAALVDLVDVAGKLGRAGGRAPGPDGRNVDHVCFRIDRFDLAALQAHLAAHAVHVGEAGLRFGAEGRGPSLYLQDPEGNTIELKGPPADQMA
jgi:catechol-2,3-dioxygenase